MGQPNVDEERILTGLSSNSSNNNMTNRRRFARENVCPHQGEVIMEKKVKHYQ